MHPNNVICTFPFDIIWVFLESVFFDHRLYLLHSFFYRRIYFVRISRLEFAKYFKNKAEGENLKSIDIILCVQVKHLYIQYNFMFFT